jgi:hypothetical protein
MVDRQHVENWLNRLKISWESGDGEGALALFASTKRYYERPFSAATTIDQIREYWKDIDGLDDIVFDFEIIAVEANRAVVHWQNSFKEEGGNEALLDGVFAITFDDAGSCIEFRQWWFAR